MRLDQFKQKYKTADLLPKIEFLNSDNLDKVDDFVFRQKFTSSNNMYLPELKPICICR